MYNKITATYSEVNGEMVHDGYFLYSEGAKAPLAWISINDIKKV